MFVADNAFAQREDNPKLVRTFPTKHGSILIVDTWKEIHSSGINSNDLVKLNETVVLLERRNKEQEETITKQQEEIVKLQRENRAMKSELQNLQQTFTQLQKRLEAVEKKLPN